jgi:hypothetical protein
MVWPVAVNSDLMRSAPPEFIARFPSVLGSWWLSLLMLAYGMTALRTAKALWRVSPSAASSYVWWAVVVVLVMLALSVSMPGVPVFATIGFFVPVFALLAGGWLLTRRLVRS